MKEIQDLFKSELATVEKSAPQIAQITPTKKPDEVVPPRVTMKADAPQIAQITPTKKPDEVVPPRVTMKSNYVDFVQCPEDEAIAASIAEGLGQASIAVQPIDKNWRR